MNLEIIIRKARSEESEILSKLALRSKAYWGYSAEFLAACRDELYYSPQDLENNYFYVAELNGAIASFYGLEIVSATEVELEALFVEPAYIGRGYGRKLIEHAKEKAIALGGKLMLIQGDPNAKDFYLKMGAKLTGKSPSASIRDRYLPTFAIDLREVSADREIE